MRRLLMALVVSFLPVAASAQMAGGPDVGYKREAGMVSSALPAPLREIGFDQNIGQRLPLDTPVRDEDGRVGPIGTYVGQRPGATLRLSRSALIRATGRGRHTRRKPTIFAAMADRRPRRPHTS